MNTNLAIEPEVVSDAALVELSLDGDRDSFGRLVARYQSPICAMAFSACGNVERSEDVAQEIFVTAWRKLSSLSEAGKFKAWLYGIARNLINNSFRHETRNPVSAAEALEDGELVDFDLPDEQAISNEEQAILWHVLSGLPQVYREPMVLFYRQNESVPKVAEALDISEEAVRQRLSRGRLMLAERVTRVIRSGLRRSGPGPGFAVAVIGALPILAAVTTAKGAVIGVSAAKGATGNAGWLASLKCVGIFASVLAVPAAIGGFVGRRLGKDAEGSASQQMAVGTFWRVFGWLVGGLVFAPLMIALFVTGFLSRANRTAFLSVMTNWLGFSYAGVAVVLVYWMWKRSSAVRVGSVTKTASQIQSDRPRKIKWIVVSVTVGAIGLLIFCLFDTNFNIHRSTPAELREVVKQNVAGDLRAYVMEMHQHSMFRTYPTPIPLLRLEVRHGGKTTKFMGPSDDETLAVIAAKGLQCPTYVQGRDFEILGTPGRMLPFLLAFLSGIGAVYTIKRRRRAELRTGFDAK